ncbi:hypothetical protein SARC_01441 [Sphaeroforma arctica JP610]|uniref:ubiquitinyl hydrolase 1 n=1 Tax=Sphaeroforma arctica JP610 TaxID=667725 RepID=A0A0L0GBR0_9EUKA|nr:hypothetical protein SARC_01441 [Sphaeroforma arctica JP610]KNC86435.1 hypothetical protein SARC_01441 [Sphaeroforma arctica JP610]|eukprot:XP_014160337.1 hypothetical protein SARC_01441 [Sphaeroforma arctica JP610]
MPKSRRVTAVPFVGKDVPSTKSEFSHPDVLIGLTALSYRYQGLRKSDFKTLIKAMQDEFWDEGGPFAKRPSAVMYAEWVVKAGCRVRGSLLGRSDSSSLFYL